MRMTDGLCQEIQDMGAQWRGWVGYTIGSWLCVEHKADYPGGCWLFQWSFLCEIPLWVLGIVPDWFLKNDLTWPSVSFFFNSRILSAIISLNIEILSLLFSYYRTPVSCMLKILNLSSMVLTSLSYFPSLFFFWLFLLTSLLKIFKFGFLNHHFSSILFLCLSLLTSFVFVSTTVLSAFRFLIVLYAPILSYSLCCLTHNLLFLFYECKFLKFTFIPSFVSRGILSLPISKSFSNDFVIFIFSRG